jgi:hypothetical protein
VDAAAGAEADCCVGDWAFAVHPANPAISANTKNKSTAFPRMLRTIAIVSPAFALG